MIFLGYMILWLIANEYEVPRKRRKRRRPQLYDMTPYRSREEEETYHAGNQ